MNSIKPAEWWAEQKFGKLRLKTPEAMKISINKKEFICDCGNTNFIRVNLVVRGITKSCGKCKQVPVSFGQQICNLVYVGTKSSLKPSSSKKDLFRCGCGSTVSISISKVFGGQKTCGKCSVKSVEWWTGRKFGRLQMTSPALISNKSIKKVNFTCDCGNIKSIRIDHVVRGSITSCNNCHSLVRDWYAKNVDELKNLHRINDVDGLPPGGIIALGYAQNSGTPFEAACPVCGGNYRPRLSDIKRGLSLTCGCSSNRISSYNKSIADFIRQLGLCPQFEFELNGKFFDIYVPEKNLLIEFNGFKWHSFDNSKLRDAKKCDIAKKNGFEFISIFEDEWRQKSDILKSLLKYRMGLGKPSMLLRPKLCYIEKIKSSDVSELYERFHYIGPCACPINYGVFFGGKLIGGVSFRRPSRQSCKHDFELSRMVMDNEFKVHGIWSKILKMFINEFRPNSVVSFSDNRLFTGSTYEKLGFRYDGDVPQDYYWVKGNVRFHKSKLRKPVGCKETESELRTSQGFSKVWDLGKKRWVFVS